MPLSFVQSSTRRIQLAKEFVPGLALIFFGLYLIAIMFGLNALAFYNEGGPTPTFWEYFCGTLIGGLPFIGPGLLLVIAGVVAIRRKINRFSKRPGKPSRDGEF